MKIDFMKDCKKVRLGDIFIKLTRKNTENNTNVLTISAKYGLVNQEEFFSKSVASDNKSNYFLLYKGDFAYNKSYSNGYPFGAIKVLQRYEKGIVSPLYICFSPAPENYCPEFYLHYFESGLMNKAIRAIAQEGARNHGLLNIGIDDFFNISIPLPSLEIQQKIAKILSTQDKLIELKQKLIDKKKQQKKWLMQNLLTGKIRLKGFEDEWKKISFFELFEEYSRYTNNSEKYPLFSLTIENGVTEKPEQYERSHLVKKDNNYKIVMPNEFVYNPMNIRFGAVARNKMSFPVIVSGYYDVFVAKYDSDNGFFDNYLVSYNMINYYNKVSTGSLNEKKRVHFSQFINFKLVLPDVKERKAIAKILSTQDREIELLEKELEQEKLKKKALMQLLLTVK